MLGTCTQFGIIKKINRRENANCPSTEKGKTKAIMHLILSVHLKSETNFV